MDKDTTRQVVSLINLWLPWKMKYDKIPGISIGIVYKGKLLYKKGFGFADVRSKKRATEKTLYHVASQSKMFTATAIMQLVEEGKLRLDDKITDHLPWFKVQSNQKDSRYITIRQLLSHTAGVFRDGNTSHWSTGNFPNDLKKAVSELSLTNENLTGFKYTNYGYALLGAVIEKVSGMTYSKYINDHIFKPLNLKSTYTDYRSELSHVAVGYGAEFPDKKREIFKHFKANAYSPATGFVSNVEDLAKFISIFSNNRNKLLQSHSKREMMYPISKIEDDDEYGLGFDISSVLGRKTIGHGGGYSGYTTLTLFNPKSDIGVIVLSNSIKSSAPAIAFGVLYAIFSFIDDKKHSISKKSKLNPFEGVYRDSWGDKVVMPVGTDLISFSPDVNSPMRNRNTFVPKKNKKNTFTMMSKNVFSSYGEEVVFRNLKNGKFQEMIMAGTKSFRVNS